MPKETIWPMQISDHESLNFSTNLVTSFSASNIKIVPTEQLRSYGDWTSVCSLVCLKQQSVIKLYKNNYLILFWRMDLDKPTVCRGIRSDFEFLSHFPMKLLYANRTAPDGTLHSATSHLELCCLPMSHKKDVRLK